MIAGPPAPNLQIKKEDIITKPEHGRPHCLSPRDGGGGEARGNAHRAGCGRVWKAWCVLVAGLSLPPSCLPSSFADSHTGLCAGVAGTVGHAPGLVRPAQNSRAARSHRRAVARFPACSRKGSLDGPRWSSALCHHTAGPEGPCGAVDKTQD